jgi:ubiquinone/menaquinone biosynthesis C-methylase UbiE
MRKVFRHESNDDYWDRRWQEASEDRDFTDMSIYPIAYAEKVVSDPGEAVLEVGCGLGRVVKHYHARGHKISGIERSKVAVDRLHETSPELDIRLASADALPFSDAAFDVLLAFGVFHNIEDGVEQSLAECARVLKPGGRFCISMRPDNMEMRLNERVWRARNPQHPSKPPRFHKWLTNPSDFAALLSRNDLRVEQTYFAANMSVLYRIKMLRDKAADAGTEANRRSSGYRLNGVGRVLHSAMRAVSPYQTCNVIVFTGRRGDRQ